MGKAKNMYELHRFLDNDAEQDEPTAECWLVKQVDAFKGLKIELYEPLDQQTKRAVQQIAQLLKSPAPPLAKTRKKTYWAIFCSHNGKDQETPVFKHTKKQECLDWLQGKQSQLRDDNIAFTAGNSFLSAPPFAWNLAKYKI